MTPSHRVPTIATAATAAFATAAFTLFGLAGAAAAQDEPSLREAMIDNVQAECNALADAGDSRVTDCEEAVADMRRSTSPVVVARIRDQYRADRDERVAAAAAQEFDLFRERGEFDWAPYGDEIAD
ncbi:MAG TPA: hypothetical protein RMF84_05610 [Polyangiaceae bacterium LLY-WYZ-14_1]|nr:hypothetical protein [Polyangiaceae bacterium LLY-WYZ-14_1]